MNPVLFQLLILPLVTNLQARHIPESSSPLHRRLARSEVYQVNALTDDIPPGLRAEFSEEDVNDTVQEVQKLLDEDPSLPRLSRAEILALFDNVTRSEKLTKDLTKSSGFNVKVKEDKPVKIDLAEDGKITSDKTDKNVQNYEKAKEVNEGEQKKDARNEDEKAVEDKEIIVEETGTSVVLLDESINKQNSEPNYESITENSRKEDDKTVVNTNEDEKYVTSSNSEGVYVVLPEKIEPSTEVYFENTGAYENFNSQTEQVQVDENITENIPDDSTSTDQITSKPDDDNHDQFNIDIDKLSELTRSSFEDTKNGDVLNLNIEPTGENRDENKMTTFSQQGSIRYYNHDSDRHRNHKYSEEDKAADDIILDTILNQKRPVYLTSTVKPKPRLESTGRPFSAPTTTPQDYIRFQPVIYTTQATTTTAKTVTEDITTLKPDDATIKIPYTIQPFERLTLASIRPETYSRFRPLPKPDATLTKDMESFLAEFGLVPSQNRVNRKLVTPQPKKPANTHVFNPSNSTRVSLQKLTQLLDAVKQLENLDGTLTTKDLDKIADKLEALGIGTRNDGFSKLSLGPNPVVDKYNVDTNKNEIKRQQPNTTEGILKFDLLSKNSTSGDQDVEQTQLKIVNSEPTTTEKPVDLLALEESFGAPIDPSTIDEELPPPRKNGLYFLADWNSFLEVGEDNKDKVVIRFNPKVGDASRFLPVTVP